MTIRDLIEQGVHIQGDTITIQTWNEATNFENKILGACYNNLTTDGIEQYLDCEITYIYQVNHQLVIEIKTKEGQV